MLAAAVVGVLVMFSGAQDVKAGSPVRFGVKAGMTVNKMKFNEDAFSTANRNGYTAGATMQFVAPIINVGFDASLMFTHRSNNVAFEGSSSDVSVNRNYIEIPINFRYNIGLPVVGKVFTPFLTTGPDFSFLVSKKNVKNAWNNKTVDVAWNFGLGVKLFDKVEVAASYGLGIKSSASGDAALYGNNPVSSKNRFWTITAAYLF